MNFQVAVFTLKNVHLRLLTLEKFQATNGTLEGIRTHMNGLEQMVRMRGGLQQGGFSAHLRRLIAWADLNSANALSTAPRFAPLSDQQHLQSDQFAIDPIAFQLYSTPPPTPPANTNSAPSRPGPCSAVGAADRGVQALGPNLASCFTTLRQLSRLLNIAGPKAVIRMDHAWYSDMAYMLQRRLMHLAAAAGGIERPCCVAALIYLECCIREIHPRSRIVETLVGDLRAALLPVQGRLRARMSHLLFWALVVGVAASGGKAEHDWFVAQLGALSGAMGVGGWEGARRIVQGILWPERESELTRALVWTEIEMAVTSIDCWTVGSD